MYTGAVPIRGGASGGECLSVKMTWAAQAWRMTLTLVAVTFLVALGTLARAGSSGGKIVVSGDEWAFSNDGLPNNSTYVTNVLKWFGLAPNGSGKKVLILDGQSWNSGYNGTAGAFGSDFRSLLTGFGAAVTYLGYQDDPVSPTGYDAVFVDGRIVKATTLTNDLANFVGGGGAVYLAAGTGTFSPADAATEAAYWQPFFTAATGSGDFGLVGGNSWFEENLPLQLASPIGDGVTVLKWFMGQGVQVGSNPNASAAIWDSAHTLVATWSARANISISREGSKVILSWPGSHILQTSTNVVGAYVDNLSATSPFTNSIDPTGSCFFRLR
jgi:hypothetical protein